MPVWRGLIDHYYPGSAWLRLPRDVFDRLREYRKRHGCTDWAQAFERLLDEQTTAKERA